MSNKYQIQKAYDKLRRAKDKDILSLVGQTDWKIVDDVIMNRAMFVAPSGEIVAAKSSKGTHDRFPEDLILYVSGLPENEEPTDPFYFEQVTYDLLRDLTRLKGWIRLNGGSNAVEERCYAVLTDWNEGRPTNTQLYVLEDFINMAYDNNREYVIIFFGEGGIDSKTFYFNQYMPEDIMRIVKRYYTSGRIYEGLKKKRLKEDVREVLDLKDYVVSWIPKYSTYILQDGDFLDLEGGTHGAFQMYCDECEVVNDNILNNAIQCNDGTSCFDEIPYPYAELSSKVRPTIEQYDSLLRWLDRLQSNGSEEVEINIGANLVLYHFDEYTTDDIINRIKRYYASGVLYENRRDKVNEAYEEPPTDYGTGEVDWDSPYWDDVDLNDPNLDIDALLKKVGKSGK